MLVSAIRKDSAHTVTSHIYQDSGPLLSGDWALRAITTVCPEHHHTAAATPAAEGRGRITSNSGPLTGPRLWSRLRASLGAGLGARGAGAGGTPTAGPLQGALQDGLRPPEVRVAARTAEHSDYTLVALPSVDESTVQSHPQCRGVRRVLAPNGSMEMTVMLSSVELLALDLDGMNSWARSWAITLKKVLALKRWLFEGGFLLNLISCVHVLEKYYQIKIRK